MAFSPQPRSSLPGASGISGAQLLLPSSDMSVALKGFGRQRLPKGLTTPAARQCAVHMHQDIDSSLPGQLPVPCASHCHAYLAAGVSRLWPGAPQLAGSYSMSSPMSLLPRTWHCHCLQRCALMCPCCLQPDGVALVMQHNVMPSLCCAGMHPTSACLTHDDERNMLFCVHGGQQLIVHTLKLQGQGASCEVSRMVCVALLPHPARLQQFQQPLHSCHHTTQAVPMLQTMRNPMSSCLQRKPCPSSSDKAPWPPAAGCLCPPSRPGRRSRRSHTSWRAGAQGFACVAHACQPAGPVCGAAPGL